MDRGFLIGAGAFLFVLVVAVEILVGRFTQRDDRPIGR
jgi:hypothetical protein